MFLSCTVSEILSLISQKLERSRDSEHIHLGVIYHTLVFPCINQYTIFEVPSFTNYKDMTGTKFKKNGPRDIDHAPFVIPELGHDIVYL